MKRFAFLNRAYFTQGKTSKAEDPKMEYLYGINPVLMALTTKTRTFEKLVISNSDAVKLNSRITKIINHVNAMEKPIPIQFSAREKLDSLVRGQPHQNVLLKCSIKKYHNITDEITK